MADAERFLFTARQFRHDGKSWHEIDRFQVWTVREDAKRKAREFLASNENWTVSIEELQPDGTMNVLMDRQG